MVLKDDGLVYNPWGKCVKCNGYPQMECDEEGYYCSFCCEKL